MTTILVICALVALVLMANLISKAIDIRNSLADVARESSNLHRTLTQLHADKNKDTAKLICSIEAARSSCEGIRMTEGELHPPVRYGTFDKSYDGRLGHQHNRQSCG